MNVKVEQIIGIWLKLAREEKLAGELRGNIKTFFKFMALWVAFNAYYSNKYRSCNTDRAQALEFAKEKHRQLFHKEHLESSKYLEAMSILTDDKLAIHDKNGKRVTITDKTDFEQVMKNIYQIRCNLFHGRKPICNTNDVQIVDAAYEILLAHFENIS